MAELVRGRQTHQHHGGLVVFLIGMRVNRWWAVRAWLPTLLAMAPMLRELSRDPGSGFLGYRAALSPSGPLLVQYWRDRDSLLAYASSPEHAHRPAWRRFNARARSAGGAVGLWHETFDVPPGGHESIYVDMPVDGLAAATASVPVTAHRDRAAQRFGP